MKIDSAKIEALRELLAAPHRKIVLVAHTNPDGDAIGASTAAPPDERESHAPRDAEDKTP